jgi:hypothetical protein
MLHPASWVIVVIGPPVWMNICDIVTITWTCRQPDHLGSRSDCQAISTTNRTPLWTSSLMHRVFFFFFIPPLALIFRYFFNLMSYQVDDVFDTHWRVHDMCQFTAWLSRLWVLFSGKLNRLYTLCMMHGSRNDTLKLVPQSQRDVGYCDGVTPWGL